MLWGLIICTCDIIFRFTMMMCPLSNSQWKLKKDLMKSTFLPLPSLSDDAEEWHLQDHVSARFIWLEFIFIFELQNHYFSKGKKNFPLSFIPFSSSLLGSLLCNIVGSWIHVWSWAFPLVTEGKWPCLTAGQRRHGPRCSLWSAEVIWVNQILTSERGSTQILQSEG